MSKVINQPEHTPFGDPCVYCGSAANKHRKRDRREYRKQYRKQNRDKIAEYKKAHYPYYYGTEKRAIGIDGEGWTDKKTGKHYYSYLAACTRDICIGGIYEPFGLESSTIFEFLCNLPIRKGDIIVGFSLGYDITKWLEGLPNSTIYLLSHPELRQGKNGARPVRWMHYRINRMSTRFSVKNDEGRQAVVWDLFKFFGKAFVPSLKDWKVGTEKEWAAIQEMKDKRGDFNGISEAEQAYCRSECMLLARMAETLIDAHKDAGIPLAQYYGPGSTASSMLKSMKAKEETAKFPIEMNLAIEKAFFGGRFETSVCGPVNNVWSYDIASAYPFAMTQLPCLKHGKWELRKNPRIDEIEKASAACIHYRLRRTQDIKSFACHDKDLFSSYVDVDGEACTNHAWGPFPFRLKDGNILFPITCAGGWVWQTEYLEALKHYENIECSEAWILKQSCDCGYPFAERVADYYNKRLEWGKEGKGIALKLGINSCYGKRAQRVGSAPFRCVISAGLITSRCRSMLMHAIFQASDPWQVVSLATDGIQATCELKLPLPPKTGTEGVAELKGKFPLGAWESKEKSDQHMIRPGMRFVPNLEAKTSSTAARGLGVRVLHENRKLVLDTWQRDPMKDVFIQQPVLFMGAKSCIRPSAKAREALERVKKGECQLVDISAEIQGEFSRDDKYGNWIRPEPRVVSYNPLPKRPTYDKATFRLYTWALPDSVGESVAYGASATSQLVKELQELKRLEEEQADQEGFHTLDNMDI